MSEQPINSNGETDWARIDAMTDDDIDTSDTPPLTDAFFKRARVRVPNHAVTMTVQVDADVADWFRRRVTTSNTASMLPCGCMQKHIKRHISLGSRSAATMLRFVPSSANRLIQAFEPSMNGDNEHSPRDISTAAYQHEALDRWC